MALDQRIKRLEQSGGGDRCPVCGHSYDWSKLRFEINVVDSRPGQPPEKNKHCPACHIPLVLNIPPG